METGDCYLEIGRNRVKIVPATEYLYVLDSKGNGTWMIMSVNYEERVRKARKLMESEGLDCLYVLRNQPNLFCRLELLHCWLALLVVAIAHSIRR